MAIAGFALFVLGIILIVVSSINRKKNSLCSTYTQGTLVEVFEGDSSNGGGANAYVYSYNVNGNEYQIRSTIRSKEANDIGDNCIIWYNPAKPKDAQPFHYESDKVYKIIFIIGIVMLLSGICLPFMGFALRIR